MPSNVNEAVGFIKKAGRNMLLTIERPDVTQEPGDHHVSVIKFAHDDVRVPEPGREREELQHCVWRGPEQAPVPWGLQLRIRGEAMASANIFTSYEQYSSSSRQRRRRRSDRRSSWRPDRPALPRRRGGSR